MIHLRLYSEEPKASKHVNVANVGNAARRGIFLHKLHSPIQAVEGDNNLADQSLEISKTAMESLRYLGSLPGHAGWVTAIATSSENPDMILTASRGAQLKRSRHRLDI